jgi:ketosteroid isomerase-like protein
VDDKFAEAFNKEDLEGVLAFYADDATMIDPGPGLWYRGKEEIRKSWGDFLAAVESPKIVLHDFTYTVKGEVGYCAGLFDISFKDAKSGQMVQMTGRASSVFEKRGGKWVYVIDHASVPVPPPPAAAEEDPAEHPSGGGK